MYVLGSSYYNNEFMSNDQELDGAICERIQISLLTVTLSELVSNMFVLHVIQIRGLISEVYLKLKT